VDTPCENKDILGGLMDLNEEIAKVAYELYERDGKQDGKDREHWLEAERIVRARRMEYGKAESGRGAAPKAKPAAPPKEAPKEAPKEVKKEKTAPKSSAPAAAGKAKKTSRTPRTK
jgi:hypothetical protein